VTRVRVPVIRTGTANLASVLAALRRAGAEPELSSDPEVVAGAERVVLPGVGAFAAAMEGLRAADLAEAVAERVRTGAATLCICLGLQLLGEGSEEDEGEAGLGALAFHSRRIRPDEAASDLRVPHLGWNRVEPDPGCELLEPGHAYFAHSYRVCDVPDGWRAGRTEYGGSFVSALERGRVLACQFHPELSGAWGLGLIRRWLEGGSGC
jgi:imidazole glycerol phosphate synthase glutamine amidotransferase subunit